jgi:hypothetical protein
MHHHFKTILNLSWFTFCILLFKLNNCFFPWRRKEILKFKISFRYQMTAQMILSVGNEGKVSVVILHWRPQPLSGLSTSVFSCFYLQTETRDHTTCLSLELAFRRFSSQSRTKGKKLLNYNELLILEPSLLGLERE